MNTMINKNETLQELKVIEKKILQRNELAKERSDTLESVRSQTDVLRLKAQKKIKNFESSSTQKPKECPLFTIKDSTPLHTAINQNGRFCLTDFPTGSEIKRAVVLTALLYLSIIVAFVSFVFSLIPSSPSFYSVLLIVSVICLCVVGFIRFLFYNDKLEKATKFTKSYADYEKEHKTLVSQIISLNAESFKSKWQKFDADFSAFIEAYTKEHRESSTALEQEIEKVEEEARIKLQSIDSKIEEVNKSMEQHTLIHNSLFEHVSKILRVLEFGRADTLKEAINIVLDDIRKDEEEAARQSEAMEREWILEQQAIETASHNRRMQEMAEREAEESRKRFEESELRARKEAADARRREEERNREMKQAAEREERARKNAITARCYSCANFNKCSSYVRGKLENCASFVPK